MIFVKFAGDQAAWNHELLCNLCLVHQIAVINGYFSHFFLFFSFSLFYLPFEFIHLCFGSLDDFIAIMHIFKGSKVLPHLQANFINRTK